MAGKLTTLKIKSLNKPGRYGDGDGLWLQVRAAATAGTGRSASRSWLFRFMLAGKARQMGLGSSSNVSLAEAREAASTARQLLAKGHDPIEHRAAEVAAKAAAITIITFKEVAEHYLAQNEAAWRNAKHRWQWRQTLEKHVYPKIGELPVDQITTAHVMMILEHLWGNVPETASRLRGRIEAVLDYAKARDWRAGENPARWRGHVSNMLPRRNKARSVKHHPALHWRDIGAFVAALRKIDGTAALALEFTILTAARTGETIGAEWQEIDFASGVWTIPKDRMKAGNEHRVPLTTVALKVLQRADELRGDSRYVFPGSQIGRPLSNMAMTMLLRRMKRSDITVHGFRSTFRDWAAEATDHSGEVAEAALAHVVADRVEAAYRRGDLFEKRRLLMQDWTKSCASAPNNESIEGFAGAVGSK